MLKQRKPEVRENEKCFICKKIKKNGDMQTSSRQLRKAVCCANKKSCQNKKKRKKWKRKTQKHKKRKKEKVTKLSKAVSFRHLA